MEQGPAWLSPSRSTYLPPHQRHHYRLHVTVSTTACLSIVIVLIALPLACLALPKATDSGPITLSCPDRCSCPPPPNHGTGVQGVTCASSGLSTFPAGLPLSLLSLNLSHNSIEHLNVSRFMLMQVFDLSSNALTTLPAGSLDNLFQLTSLDLSRNNIATIEDNVFGALASIQTLNLAHNNLNAITDSQLFGLHTLKELNLSSNFIKELGNATFLYLIHLEVLDLTNNHLHYLDLDAFQGLPSLQTLLLQHNHLLTITGVFNGLQQLNTLDLAYNWLRELEINTIIDLPSLSTLQLSFNNISQISPHFCGAVSSVQTLDLRGNTMQQLASRAFLGMHNLQTLDLSQMPYLGSVSHAAFDSLHSLSLLNLSLNPQLSFLHPDALASLNVLSVLDLRWCQLQTLSHVTFHANPHLARLYLSHNPFRCGCGLLWMLGPHSYNTRPTNASLVADLNLTMCRLQSNVSIPVPQMSTLPVQCSEVELHNVTGEAKVRIGGTLLLTCDYSMNDNETGVLTWITPQGLVFHYHHPLNPETTAHLISREGATNLASPFHHHHTWHRDRYYDSNLQQHPDHIVLLSDGSLFVDYMLRSDAGPYTCVVHNSQYRKQQAHWVHLNCILFEVKIMSILVGLGCAASFFALNTVYVVIMWVARKLINKRRRERIHKALVSVDEYRAAQLSRIRANYNFQIGRIRDHYHCQSTRLRDNYNTQLKRVRRGCSNQVERIRDNYNQRLCHLKDYSSYQIQQIRDATNNQMARMRDYGSSQMDKLRETYKLQSKHVMKMMEAMNLDNCKTVMEAECMHTESMFDLHFPDFPDVEVDDAVSTEAEDVCSQSESIYVTALNTDVSSQESLATVVNANQVVSVQDVTIELPVDAPMALDSENEQLQIEVLPSGACICIREEGGGDECNSSRSAESTVIKETIV